MTQSALVAAGTKGVKKPRLPIYNDRMVRVYEGNALQMRLEKSTSGVRISLRSQNNLSVSSNWLGQQFLKLQIWVRIPVRVLITNGVLVQLARTSALQAGGRRFESDILHNKSIWGLSLGGRLMTSK